MPVQKLLRLNTAYALMAVAAAGAGLAPALAQDLPLAGALPACDGGSTGIVLSVLPSGGGALLYRSGQAGRLHDLATLCPGDRLVLGAGDVAVVDLQDIRSSDEPLNGPTEFIVPAAQGMLGNAGETVARLLFPEVSDRTRTLVTRSDGGEMSPLPENMGLRLPQELAAVEGPRSLWFGWTGGAAPYHVVLEDSSGAALAEADVSESEASLLRARYTSAEGVVAQTPYDVTFSGLTLEPGDYRFRVSDPASEPADVAALMSDEDAGVMSMPFQVRSDLTGVPARASAEAISVAEIRAAVEAICFSLEQPESRLFEAAQHVVANGEIYGTALALIGTDLVEEDRAALCGQ